MFPIAYFLTNPEFVRWVRQPDRELDTYWQKWMEANPEGIAQLKLAREIILGIRFEDIKPTPGTKEQVLSGILREEMSEPVRIPVDSSQQVEKTDLWSRLSQFSRVAAILVLGISLAWILVPSSPDVPLELAVNPIDTIEKKAAFGEKLNIQLPDGSKVWLNSGSFLSYPEKFDDTSRKITLSGEAFFEVEPDRSRPFQVHSEGVVTTALGTSFNVNTKDAGSIKVSLLTGKVQVGKEAALSDIVLNPGEEYHLDRKEGGQTIQRFDPGKTLAWKEGRLIFEQASLPEVVRALEEWYGVELTLVNPPGIQWKFSGTYQNQMLETVLNSMSFIENFDYTINGKKVKLTFHQL